jgi:hypothetical protein
MKKILLFLLMIIMCVSTIAHAEFIQYSVTASGLNIRQSPNTNSPILGVAKYGTILSGENSINGWTPIVWNDNRAFVFSIYIKKMNPEPNGYTQSDLDLLARVIFSEAGSDWLTDEHQRAVASVVINRVNDSRFPNTIRGVVYQKGQYGCVYNGMIYKTPNQRAYDNARYVLENGVTIPTNVVWQAQCKQGNGVWKYIQGHYFCY